jgi:SAM-dependent methyltransferase
MGLPKGSGKDRSQFLNVLNDSLDRNQVDRSLSILILGGSEEDWEVIRRAGFTRIMLSNIEGAWTDSKGSHEILALDAENIALPSNYVDVVFVHEVIHHSRSPHRALCEMLRVAKRYVIFMEPNDSFVMRLLGRLRFSFPYEIAAVVDNHYLSGGVRNTNIPNFIFRWSQHEVQKTVDCYLPEFVSAVKALPYWDFNVDEREVEARTLTRIGLITGVIGTHNFVLLLRLIQRFLNRIGPLRRQGNKFYCFIEKGCHLQPWLKLEDGNITFDCTFHPPLPPGLGKSPENTC